MIEDLLTTLRQTTGVEVGASERSENGSVPSGLPQGLPEDYVDFLRRSNGLTAYGGYFRIFGVSPSLVPAVAEWNQLATWKFAWGDRCNRFWCFGETAFGDQYAFDTDELAQGIARVYFLEALGMTPEPLAASFQGFLSDELLRNAVKPYDSQIVLARQEWGDIDPYQRLVYTPSPLIGGPELLANLCRMNVFQGQIVNGDMASQVDAVADGSELVRVEEYRDSSNRSRIRLVWR